MLHGDIMFMHLPSSQGDFTHELKYHVVIENQTFLCSVDELPSVNNNLQLDVCPNIVYITKD